MIHNTTVIGLGGMGQTMLMRMAEHPRFDVVSVWDPTVEAMERARDGFPGVELAASSEEAINHPQSNVVYIASPPLTHAGHAIAAFEANKAVYCEKPLGVDVETSRSLVTLAQGSHSKNIVNFSLASTSATRSVEEWLRNEQAGAISGVEISIHFSQWPRQWQMSASNWLAYRAQGGVGREVLSHWLYLTERLFGQAKLDDAQVRYAGHDMAESHINATLSVGAIPVTITCGIGGIGPDEVRYTIWGSKSSARISNWHRLSVTDGDDWEIDLSTVKNPGDINSTLQLDNASAAVAGEPNSMPDFSDALSVQVLVEAILA